VVQGPTAYIFGIYSVYDSDPGHMSSNVYSV